MTIHEVLAHFENVKKCGKSYRCRCPVHDDKTPSLIITPAENGGTLIKCMAGCATKDVVERVGLKMQDLMAPQSIKPRKSIAAVYNYYDANGGKRAEKVRYDDKSFTWRYEDEGGKTVWKKPHGVCLIYNLHILANYPKDKPKAAFHYETPKRHALTIQQEQAFLDFIKDTPQYRHWLPIFTFLLGTGCRISEAVGLCWSDVDFENAVILIHHNLVYHQHEAGKCYFTLSTPKTAAGKRTVPLVDEVREALLQEREHQEKVGLTSQYEIEGLHDFIFLNRYGFPQNPQTVNRAIGRIVNAYNDKELERAATERREPFYLPAFSCHNLRHTFCTRLCEVETNLKIIQDIMGHADISTTMKIYAEVTQQAKANAANKLSGKLGIPV